MTIPKPRSEVSLSHSDESFAYCNKIAFHRRSIRAMFFSVIAALALICVLSACTNDLGLLKKERRAQDVDPRKRLSATFSTHNFGPYCFDTLECRIEYDGRVWVNEKTQSGPLNKQQRGNLTGSIVGITNFPGPVSVSWRSLDGRAHETNINLGQIFEDRRIVHSQQLDVSDVPKDAAFLDPDIIVIVENSMVQVYMKAFIPLMHPKKGLSTRSNHRDEAVLVWTRHFLHAFVDGRQDRSWRS